MIGISERFEGFPEACDLFTKYIDKTETYKKQCAEKLSECDRKLADLDHCLRLEKLDGVQMSKVTSLRKRILKERDACKDDLSRVELVINSIPNSQVICSTLKKVKEEMIALEQRLQNRSYAPHILKELFPDSDNPVSKMVAQSKKLVSVDHTGIIRKTNKEYYKRENMFRGVV